MSKTLKKYWQSYGGFKALLKSPFLWLSFLMTITSYEFFLDIKWLDIPISMLPSLLGFNIASYSVWLAFGNHKLNKILSKLKEDQVHSRYMEINSSFIHFILAQILCLIFVVLLKTNSTNKIIYLTNLACFNSYMKFLEYAEVFINGLIFFLFCYCLFSMLAAVLGFIGIASGLDIIYRQEYKDDLKNKRSNQQEIIKKEILNKKIEEELELLKIKKIKEELEISILQKVKNELELLINQKISSINPAQEKIKKIIRLFKSK